MKLKDSALRFPIQSYLNVWLYQPTWDQLWTLSTSPMLIEVRKQVSTRLHDQLTVFFGERLSERLWMTHVRLEILLRS
jgi:hypothetical protein